MTKHTLSSTLGTATVSGIGGAIIGSVIEAVGSHRAYKNGEISEEKYATEIIKSGAQAGTTAAITTVATIPLAAGLAAAGLASTPVLIPLSIAVSSVVDKIIAPAFKRGVYKDAKDSIDHLQESVMEPMNCLVHTSLDSVNNTSEFVSQLSSGFEVMNNNFSESQRLLNESMDLLNLF